jgi:hypothetical protein
MVTAPRGAERPGALRRLNEPRRVDVRADAAGLPTALRRNGRWLTVERVLDRWRTDDRWWTDRPISRMYYELLLEDGRTATVLHDEITGRWWEQRYA